MSASGDKEAKIDTAEDKDIDTKNEEERPASTAKSVSKSPKGSRSGSAKKPGSGTKSPRVKSPKAGTPSSAKKSARKSGKSSAREKDAEEENEQSDLPQDLQAAIDAFVMPEELPKNAEKLFVASKTQEIFSMIGDKDVTAEKPVKLIPKEDLLADMIKRAAVSDFSVFKKNIQNYPEEFLLLIYDADFKFGENFIIALTPEAKAEMLPPPKTADGGSGKRGADGEIEEEEDDTVYQYVPPVPKDWISQGSEKDIKEECLIQHRPRIKISIKRQRHDFGTPVSFTDRNVSQTKDGYIECASYEDAVFATKKLELDKGISAVPDAADEGTQTTWKHPKNATTQYVYREFTEEEKSEEVKKAPLGKFMKSSYSLFDAALQQNEIMNPFFDDWRALADEDTNFGNKADNHLREFQSFTDLLFSKDKTIACIDWHPGVRGLVAVSVCERSSFDHRVDRAHKLIISPSLILIWSFVDPIHPLLLLEAPDDIHSFQFCPSEPNYVAGGCANGQVVMWDLSAHADRLSSQRSNKQEKKKNSLNTLPGYSDDSSLATPVVRYCAVSSIEHSHHSAITDLFWIPDHMELTKAGVPQENKSHQCVQLFTCAADHQLYLWDIRPTKPDNKGMDGKGGKGGPVNPFKHLDLQWKPLMKVYLSKSEPGGDHNPVKFSMAEIHGDRSALTKLDSADGGAGVSLKDSSASTMGGGFTAAAGKPPSGGPKRTLQDVKTKLFIGTEEGELVYADWMPQKDPDSGKQMTPKPDFYSTLHDGRIVTIERSPFFRDILLCAGGWTFSIWKEGVNSGPILVSPTSRNNLMAAKWSPSRPSVFYVARKDGSIDVWDLLERTHEPSMTQSVSAHSITCINPFAITPRQHLLAVGDSSGTLHVMEIPWSLRHQTPNELSSISNYFDREVKRRTFVVGRWDFREHEKREIEQEAKKKAGIAPNVTLTDEEKDMRDKMEYQAYYDEEATFLRNLGILKEDDILPET